MAITVKRVFIYLGYFYLLLFIVLALGFIYYDAHREKVNPFEDSRLGVTEIQINFSKMNFSEVKIICNGNGT